MIGSRVLSLLPSDWLATREGVTMALDVGTSWRSPLPDIVTGASVGPASIDDVWGRHVTVSERTNSGWKLVRKVSAMEFWNARHKAQDTLDLLHHDLSDSRSKKGETSRDRILSIPSQSTDGFDIELFLDNGEVRASFGGLDQEFSTIAEAMRWVRRALSSDYHLRMVSIGGIPREWRLEPVAGGCGPNDALAGGYPTWFAAFRTKTLQFRRNTLLQGA